MNLALTFQKLFGVLFINHKLIFTISVIFLVALKINNIKNCIISFGVLAYKTICYNYYNYLSYSLVIATPSPVESDGCDVIVD